MARTQVNARQPLAAFKAWLGGQLGRARTKAGLIGRCRQWPLAKARAPSPIVVSIFVGGSFGIARAGLLTVQALRRAGFEVIVHDLTPVLGAPLSFSMDLPGEPDGLWIIHCNPPEAEAAMARIPRRQWDRRFVVGYWAWELSRAPRTWLRAARRFHEVWTPSQFTSDSLAAAETHLEVMAHPVVIPTVPRKTNHSRFNPNPNQRHVLVMADVNSTVERKNPAGAIAAFTRLFPAPQSGVRLIVKILGPDVADGGIALLGKELCERPDITLIADRLTDDDMASLVATCDVAVGLHRSEGFGLVAAEALAAGRPALCTGWSGVLDFMKTLPELLVAYRLIPIDRSVPIYGHSGAYWADPDLEDAAQKLGRLLEDPELCVELGDVGRASLIALGAAWSPAALKARPGFDRAALSPSGPG